jgi:hypothetical protein
MDGVSRCSPSAQNAQRARSPIVRVRDHRLVADPYDAVITDVLPNEAEGVLPGARGYG